MFNNKKTREDLQYLRRQIQSLQYLIKMDHIRLSDTSNPLVSKLGSLESDLEKLLTLIRHGRANERRFKDTKVSPENASTENN